MNHFHSFLDAKIIENSFEKLGMNPFTKDLLKSLKINDPTEVQKIFLPYIYKGIDIGIQSSTGSGKTYCYLIPVISKIIDLISSKNQNIDDEKLIDFSHTINYDFMGIIITANHDLVMQIVRSAQSLSPLEFSRICIPISNNQCHHNINYNKLKNPLQTRPIVLVGTTEKIVKLSRQALLPLRDINFIVLDEIDQLLDPDNFDNTNLILEEAGKNIEGGRQTILVSATITHKTMFIAKKLNWCKSDAKLIKTKPNLMNKNILEKFYDKNIFSYVPPNIIHIALKTKSEKKIYELKRFLNTLNSSSILIFVNYGNSLGFIKAKLKSYNIKAEILNSGLNKSERSAIIKNFRNAKFQILLTTDIIARGLDIPECSIVFNFDLPKNLNTYIHRAGRAGRIGKDGAVITFYSNKQDFIINSWQKEPWLTVHKTHLSAGEIKPF